MADEEHPIFKMGNGLITATVYLPDEEEGYYRSTRFDRSGIISQVKYGDHSFLGKVHDSRHNPLKHDYVSGIAGEFDINGPQEYSEIGVGEGFMKIAVGVLKKVDDSPYRFFKDYPVIDGGTWTCRVDRDPDSLHFEHRLNGRNGRSYVYSKTVSMPTGRPEIIISYQLKNTGEKPINAEHYSHNIFTIDDLPFGPGYRILFPFKPILNIESKNTMSARIDSKQIEFGPATSNGAFYAGVSGFNEDEALEFTLKNSTSGSSVAILHDRPPRRFAIYGIERIICPEPFFEFGVDPGEQVGWRTRIIFSIPDDN